MQRKIAILLAVIVTTSAGYPFIVDAASRLTEADTAHLIFMRSEEKLARDVYLTLAGSYPDQPVFWTIATRSEQTHTDTMLSMLEKFRIEDPEPGTEPGTLPPADQVGVFESYYFATYFTEKFEKLVSLGEEGLLEALKVGALIEELDMKDIRYCNEALYEYYPVPLPEYPDCGGLSTTTVRPLEKTLANLLAGSEHHLCAFMGQIGPLMEGACYEAEILDQAELYAIIESECPELIGFLCPGD